MSRARRSGLVVVVATLCLSLGGCSFLDDVSEGQRITTERLQVADALRVLTGKLDDLDQVDAASYRFDAVDVTTTPGLEVELGSLEPTDWVEVVMAIEDAADADVFDGYPIAASLSAGAVATTFDTQYGAAWLNASTLAAAGRIAALFPGAGVQLSGMSESGAFLALAVAEPAERLLDRVGGDPEIAEFLDELDPERVAVEFRAPGLSLGGSVASREALDWARGVLEVDLPRSPDEGSASQVEVAVSSGTGGTMLGVTLVDDALGGPGWEALVSLLISAPPELDGPGACVPLQISYAWPEVRGNWPSFTNACVSWGDSGSDPDRPALVDVRAALAASGVDLETLGFVLT